MRVVTITEYLAPGGSAPFGGVDWREKNIARIMGRSDEVAIVTSYQTGSRNELCDTHQVLRVGPKREHLQRGDFSRRARFMADACRSAVSLKPDVVCGSGFVSWLPARRAALKLGVPSVAVVHEVWRGDWIRNMGAVSGTLGQLTEGYLLRGFDGYVAVSRATASKLAWVGVPHSRIKVVTNGVDDDFFLDDTATHHNEVPIVLSVGRLTSYKRISDLLESSSRLFSRGVNHRLIIVGDGPERAELESGAANLGITETTSFMGKIEDRTEFLRLFKSCDVFVLPSVTEGMGMVLAEAMAARIPYVAADIPALRETSFGGKGGFLFGACDVEALTDSIVLALKKGRTDEGCILARNEYEWSRIVQSYSSYLNEIVDGRRGL